MHPRVELARQRLHEFAGVSLVLGDVVLQSGDYRMLVPYNLPVGLRVVRRGCMVTHAKHLV